MMGKYLDFETHEKGYHPFNINKENVKANRGKKICYVNKRSIDRHRGYYNVEYGILDSTYYSTLIIDNDKTVDIRDIVEAGIECDEGTFYCSKCKGYTIDSKFCGNPKETCICKK